jgi:hypothetical protein
VADLIRREFGVRYHVDHIGRVLRTLGWSPQKPERRARERDEAAIQRWVKVDWPQKSAALERHTGVHRRERLAARPGRAAHLGAPWPDPDPLSGDGRAKRCLSLPP